MLNLSFAELLIIIPVILISLTIHEFAHSYMAMLLGDATSREQRRMTLNPLKHIDPIGFILLLVAGFGWAKPVIINNQNFKKPFRDEVLVAIAGPASNLLLAIVSVVLMKLVFVIIPFTSDQAMDNTFRIFSVLTYMNIVLAVFNMLPIPPLDGSHLISGYLSQKNEEVARKYFQYGAYALLAIILLEQVTRIDILPIGKATNFIVVWMYHLAGIL